MCVCVHFFLLFPSLWDRDFIRRYIRKVGRGDLAIGLETSRDLVSCVPGLTLPSILANRSVFYPAKAKKFALQRYDE